MVPVLNVVIFDSHDDRGDLFVSGYLFVEKVRFTAITEISEHLHANLTACEHGQLCLIALFN